MLVHKDIVYTWSLMLHSSAPGGHADSLRWFSRGASVGGAKVKLCICAVWGSSGRPVVSPDMFGVLMTASGDQRWWCCDRSGVVEQRLLPGLGG